MCPLPALCSESTIFALRWPEAERLFSLSGQNYLPGMKRSA